MSVQVELTVTTGRTHLPVVKVTRYTGVVMAVVATSGPDPATVAVTDAGGGIFTIAGVTTVDNGDGTFTVLGATAADAGNGTFTLTA